MMRDVVDSLSTNPHFVVGWIRSFTGDASPIQRHLGIADEAWWRFLLCKTPRPQTFYLDVNAIANYVGADTIALAATFREIAALSSVRQSSRTQLMAAAKEADDDHVALTSNTDRSSSRHYAAHLSEAVTKIPVDLGIAQALSFVLPLRIVEVPGLTLEAASRWLLERGVSHAIHERNRELMGLLLAARGNGLIFVNSTLARADKDFTLLHEVGHFLFDHLIPRQRILRSEPDLAAVFDGDRPATSRDKAISFLGNIDIGVHAHLLDRDSAGEHSFDTGLHEDRASSFALDFVAPSKAVLQHLRRHMRASESYWEAVDQAQELVATHFCLPRQAARLRALQVMDRLGVRKSIIDP